MSSIIRLRHTLDWMLTASIEDLKNHELLSQKIGEAGLCHDTRMSPHNSSVSLYGDDVKYIVERVVLANKNPVESNGGLWQTPIQLASYLIFLSDKEIKTFLELGTFTGYTSIVVCTYLTRFGLSVFETYDILPICEIMYLFEEYKLPIVYRVGNPELIHKSVFPYYDVVFIDGDHSYEGISSDFSKFGRGCRFVCFHDINDYWCNGVVKFWNELKAKYYHTNNNIFEFTDHPNKFKLMGIGVLQWE